MKRCYLLLLLCVLSVVPCLHADTYVYGLKTPVDSNRHFSYAMDSTGDFVLEDTFCGGNGPCYQLYAGGLFVSNTTTPPALINDRGGACGVSFRGSTGVCNNGRMAYVGPADGDPTDYQLSIFVQTSSGITVVGSGRSFYQPMMDSMGDFVFDDGNFFNEYIDLTTRGLDAPEPSSIALFSTGLLGLAGIARRRFLRP